MRRFFSTTAAALAVAALAGFAGNTALAGAKAEEELKAVFDTADTDDDGKWSLNEYVEFVVAIPSPEATSAVGVTRFGDSTQVREEARLEFSEMDTDESGFVTLSELAAATDETATYYERAVLVNFHDRLQAAIDSYDKQ